MNIKRTIKDILRQQFIETMSCTWNMSQEEIFNQRFDTQKYQSLMENIIRGKAYELINFYFKNETTSTRDENWITIVSTLKNPIYNTKDTIYISHDLTFYNHTLNDIIKETIKIIKKISILEHKYKQINRNFKIEAHDRQKRYFFFDENNRNNNERETEEETIAIEEIINPIPTYTRSNFYTDILTI